jgi:hypothetical protein
MSQENPEKHQPPQPVHVKGTAKGEEMVLQKGAEPGRAKPDMQGDQGRQPYRTARDSTSINPEHRNPIHPDMPNIPPA